MENLHQNLLLVVLICLSLASFSFGYNSYTLLNASCTTNSVCRESETYLKCSSGRCACKRDHESFEPYAGPVGGMCRLKVEINCKIPHDGRKVQPCIKGAECDFPMDIRTGQPIYQSDTGTCRCKGDYSATEHNLCSNSGNIPKSLMSRNQSKSILVFVFITLSLMALS